MLYKQARSSRAQLWNTVETGDPLIVQKPKASYEEIRPRGPRKVLRSLHDVELGSMLGIELSVVLSNGPRRDQVVWQSMKT